MGFPVLLNDFGIRPAGKPDECFYCKKRVGQSHVSDCVVIVRDVIYRVFYKGREIGLYHTYEPSSWTIDKCEEHMNTGTWCKSNMRGRKAFKGDDAALKKILDESCGCGSILFRVAERGDVERRATNEDGNE